MAYLPSMPKGASLLEVFRMFPETNEPLIAFHESLLRGPSPFTEGERELVAAYVSGLSGCRYCHGVHTPPPSVWASSRERSRRYWMVATPAPFRPKCGLS